MDQGNRMQPRNIDTWIKGTEYSSEIDPHKQSQLIFDKGVKAIQ